VVGRIKRGDDVGRPEDEVKGSIDMTGFEGRMIEFNVLLDIEIQYV
jgi:hypothetical protein